MSAASSITPALRERLGDLVTRIAPSSYDLLLALTVAYLRGKEDAFREIAAECTGPTGGLALNPAP
jgi:hypothetical protein